MNVIRMYYSLPNVKCIQQSRYDLKSLIYRQVVPL